jgi:hypothetical protein
MKNLDVVRRDTRKKNNVEEETKTAGHETGLEPCPVFYTGGEKAPSRQQPPKGPVTDLIINGKIQV